LDDFFYEGLSSSLLSLLLLFVGDNGPDASMHLDRISKADILK